MNSHIIASLADASRRGKVFDFDHSGLKIQKSFGKDWHHPSFDFDDLCNPDRIDLIGTHKTSSLIQEFGRRGVGGTLHLPFPECLYILRSTNGDVEVLHLHQKKHEIAARLFVHTASPGSREKHWFHVPVHFSYNLSEAQFRSGCLMGYEMPYETVQTFHHLSNDVFSALVVGTMLMLDRRIEREVQPGGQTLRESNLGREKGKLKPIPEIITINLTKRRPAPSVCGPIDTSGVPRSPHNRRAHVRHLRSGKVIPVRASAIHGGGDPRHYQIFL